MAFLDRKAYEAKAWYAQSIAIENRAILGDDKLADELDRICDMRHELHANLVQKARRLYNMESAEHDMLWGYYSELNQLTGYSLCNDIEEMPYSEDPYQGLTDLEPDEYQAQSVDFYIDLIEKLNKAVEIWLRRFDVEHGTNYAPTGLSRKF